MNTQVVVLAAVTVILHVSAGRGFSVKSQNNEDQLDAGDGTGMKQVSEESDVSNRDLDTGNLMLVKESVGNDLHDIRRREARPKKRSRKREGESGDESGMDLKYDPNEKVLMKEIKDFLEPTKEMVINFMKPILDRIKHRPKKLSLGNSPDPPVSPAPPTLPPPSSTPSDSDASTPSYSDASTPSDSDAPTPSDYDASTPSDSGASNSFDSSADIFSPFPISSSKCGANERHRSMDTLSLLFPDLKSNKGEQPFVFVPLTNTLMRVVEQQIIRESQSGGDSKRKL